MRRFHSILYLALISLFLLNCRGPEGPPGPQGNPGQTGTPGEDGYPAIVYEIIFNLNHQNNWRAQFNFPQADLEYIFESDLVLVYILNGVDNGRAVWQLMPVTDFLEDGIRMINFDHTMDNVVIFADARPQLTADSPALNNLEAKIAVIPGYYSENERSKTPVNFENYEEVKAYYNLPDVDPRNRIRVD